VLLQEETGPDAIVVLVAADDQRRCRYLFDRIGQRVDRRPAALKAAPVLAEPSESCRASASSGKGAFGDGADSKLTYGMGCRFAVIPVLPSNRFLIAELSLP
jgi:hypothetical protein